MALEDDFNKHGEKGWEFVAVAKDYAIFQAARPLTFQLFGRLVDTARPHASGESLVRARVRMRGLEPPRASPTRT